MDYKVDIEELPEGLVSFAYFIGIDLFVQICEEYGGNQIYFPKKDSLMRRNRDKNIKSEYNGSNSSTLAKKYGLTNNQIKNIILKTPVDDNKNRR